jgi:hypothetical protein
MANLYIWVDDRNRERVSRTVGELARRHPQLRDFLTGGDRIEGMLNLLFPHGLPMEYYAANLSIENRPDDNEPCSSPGHQPGAALAVSQGMFVGGKGLLADSRSQPCVHGSGLV